MENMQLSKRKTIDSLKKSIYEFYLKRNDVDNLKNTLVYLDPITDITFLRMLFENINNNPDKSIEDLIDTTDKMCSVNRKLGKISQKNIIKYLRENADMTQGELAEKLNLQPSAVYKYEAGLVKNIKKDVIEKMAEIFDVSPAFIMGWESTEFKETEKLPIIGVVRAGFGSIAQEDIIGYHQAPDDGYSKEDYFYLKIKGDSMYPDIREGSLALVRMQNDLESGQLGIVLLNGDEGVIKQVLKTENSITLHSFNMYYPDRVFTGEEMKNVRILGRVVETTATW